jgi:hypothetical protein
MKIFSLKQTSTFAFNSSRPSLIAACLKNEIRVEGEDNLSRLAIYDTKGKLLNSIKSDQDFNRIVWSQNKDYGERSQGLIATTQIDGKLSIYDPQSMFVI